jgi:hypothetical protein
MEIPEADFMMHNFVEVSAHNLRFEDSVYNVCITVQTNFNPLLLGG